MRPRTPDPRLLAAYLLAAIAVGAPCWGIGQVVTRSGQAPAAAPRSGSPARLPARQRYRRFLPELTAPATTRVARNVPAAAGDASDSEKLFDGWPAPKFTFLITGRQHGYVEPCGCTGLEFQKGGLMRRHTLLKQLQARGWEVAPLDAGNQVRRFGRQPEIKFQFTIDALLKMKYRAITFGPDDLRLSIGDLAALTSSIGDQPTPFCSANVSILGLTPELTTFTVAGTKIGVTGVMGQKALAKVRADSVETKPAAKALAVVWPKLQAQQCDLHVLLVHGELDETRALVKAFPQFDLVITSGGGDEPLFEPEQVPGTKSLIVQTGAKGMYAGVIGVFAESPKFRYQRIPLDSRFKDSAEMVSSMKAYQGELQREGLQGLGLRPVVHPSGYKFVGSEACKDCHTKAYKVWEQTPHAHATESIVHPPERSSIARHFDPECLSCHVTGWNPQKFFPYVSGYLDLKKSKHLVGSGCENCHGPGSAHVAAESGDLNVTAAQLAQLRQQMVLPLAQAEKKCLECHDLDNSPDFHHGDDAFMEYWEQIEHTGKD